MGAYAEDLRRKMQGQQVSKGKLGKEAPDRTPQPQVRAGANALPSRQLGGRYIPSDMSNINPSNGQMTDLIRDTNRYGIPPEPTDPGWSEPAYVGHDRSLLRDMARMAAMQKGQRMTQDSLTLNNMSAGSNNPIYYPPPPTFGGLQPHYGPPGPPTPTSPYLDYAAAAMGSPIDPMQGGIPGAYTVPEQPPDEDLSLILRWIINNIGGY